MCMFTVTICIQVQMWVYLEMVCFDLQVITFQNPETVSHAANWSDGTILVVSLSLLGLPMLMLVGMKL